MKNLYRLWVIGMLFCHQQAFGMLAALEAAEGKKSSSSAKKTTTSPMEAAMAKTTASADAKKAPSTNPMEAAMAKAASSSPKEKAAESAKSTSDDNKASTDASSGQAKASAAPPELEVTDVHSSSLDTINIDSSGNWLEKRIWFKKGEDLFDEIRTVVKKASDIRMEFVHEVNTIGKKIDEFYEHVNFDKGQVDQMLKDILDELEQESAVRGGDLSTKERSLKLSVKNEQKQIEPIGTDIKKVDDFDNQIDKTMMQAFKIIDECRTLETKAWNNFKAIGAELDDKKARTLYYEIENAHKNIEQKVNHLQSTLLPYLKNKLITPAEQAMTKVETAVKSLEQKGINLESLIKGDQKEDQKTIKDREDKKEKEAEEKFEKQHKETSEGSSTVVPKSQDKVVKQEEPKQKKKNDTTPWYHRFVSEFWVHLCALGCWLWDTFKVLICHGAVFVCLIWQKIVDIAPGFWFHVSSFLQCAACKAAGFIQIVVGYVACVLCSIWGWLSGFFI